MAFGFGFGMPRIFTAPFTPAALFLGGEQGAWYDPSDYGVNGTLFQDSAGTTPVTAVQQPVGLMLDKSKGLVLGPELVTNGTFTTDLSGWSNNTGATWDAGAALLATATADARLAQSFTTVVGRTYRLNYQFVSGNTGNSTLRVGTSVNDFSSAFVSMSVGSFSRVFTATATTTWVVLNVGYPGVNINGKWDNISVKELPGNHAFQTTSASRPVLSARYNLLTKTEQFDDAVWLSQRLLAFGSGSVANTTATLDPLGGNTADLIVEDTTASNTHSIGGSTPASYSAATYTGSVYVKPAGRTWVVFAPLTSNSFNCYFELSGSGTVGTAGTGSTGTIQNVGNGWYRITVTKQFLAATSSGNFSIGLATADGVNSYTGNGTSGIYLWGADLRVSNDALGQPAYQRVNTATDYDTVGFKPYLAFDGVDDSLVTNSIDFTATDKMTVFAGVRKLSDADIGVVIELSANLNSNNGSFYIIDPRSSTNSNVQFAAKGTLDTTIDGLGAAPITRVITATADISGDLTTLRVNTSASLPSTADLGTGNYGNYPLFIGRRNQTTFPFNGRLYSLIVRGAASTTAQITSTETYVNQKTGAY